VFIVKESVSAPDYKPSSVVWVWEKIGL